MSQRFPRAAGVIELTASANTARLIADALTDLANRYDELAEQAHELEPSTLRRDARAATLKLAFPQEAEQR